MLARPLAACDPKVAFALLLWVGQRPAGALGCSRQAVTLASAALPWACPRCLSVPGPRPAWASLSPADVWFAGRFARPWTPGGRRGGDSRRWRFFLELPSDQSCPRPHPPESLKPLLFSGGGSFITPPSLSPKGGAHAPSISQIAGEGEAGPGKATRGGLQCPRDQQLSK